MDRDVSSLLERTPDQALEAIDPQPIEQAKRRRADMFAWRESGYVSLVFGSRVEALENLPEFDRAGHPLTSGYADEYWMGSGSGRLCGDGGILISAEMYREHVAPCLGRALEPFGGGWIHYCGGVPDGNRPDGLHLHDTHCATPGMRGLNSTTGRDWPAEIRRLIERKIVYLGSLPRLEGEPLEACLRRVFSLCDGRGGMIFTPELRGGEASAAMETWHLVQDQMWGA